MKVITEKGKKRQPILHQVAMEIMGDITASTEVQYLTKVLTELLEKNPDAVGIAAPQVGAPLRVIAVRRGQKQISVLVNPVIEHKVGWRMVEEGCLSLPKRVFLVQRSQSVRVFAQDPVTGGLLRLSARGNVLAQTLEHEIDHLDGVMLTDRGKGRERLDGMKILDPWAKN